MTRTKADIRAVSLTGNSQATVGVSRPAMWLLRVPVPIDLHCSGIELL